MILTYKYKIKSRGRDALLAHARGLRWLISELQERLPDGEKSHAH
jgi:hypothetical protein